MIYITIISSKKVFLLFTVRYFTLSNIKNQNEFYQNHLKSTLIFTENLERKEKEKKKKSSCCLIHLEQSSSA